MTVRISKASVVGPRGIYYCYCYYFVTFIRVDDIDETEDSESFIDNGFKSSSLDDAVVGWMDWRATQETADALVDVARDIQHRHSRVYVDDDSALSRAPVVGDPSIWRIKVNVSVVVYILEPSANHQHLSLAKNG
jgi:hypothetical protein